MPRKKKPLDLRLVSGNAGHRRLPGASPRVEGRLERPDFLQGRSAQLFDWHAERCHWLLAIDSSLLALWSVLQAEFESDPASMSAARLGNLRAAGAALGLDPSTRANFAGPPVEPESEAERIARKYLCGPEDEKARREARQREAAKEFFD